MSELASSTSPGGGSRPAARQALRKPWYKRSRSGGRARPVSAPRRSIVIGAARDSSRRAATRIQRSIAIPTQSKPAPRLDVDPGTRTVTAALIGLRSPPPAPPPPAASVRSDRKSTRLNSSHGYISYDPFRFEQTDDRVRDP